MTSPNPLLNGAAAFSHYGLIRTQGDGSAKFLHGHLTHDSAFEAGVVFLGSAQGPLLQLAAAPYPLLADI